MTKQTNKSYCLCPHCGGDRFQIHDRGKLYFLDGDIQKPVVERDEIAVQCLDCLAVFIDKELVVGEPQ